VQTALGEDCFSQFALEELRRMGAEPCRLPSAPEGIPLNVSCAMLTGGDRTFVSYTDGFPVTDETRQRIYQESKGAAICAMDSRFPEVYEQLHREGTALALDLGWDDKLSLEACRPLLELADYYTPNQKEAMKLTGTSTPQDAAKVLGEFFPRTVVKLDAEGVLIQERGVQSVIPVLPEYVYQDAVGAGDAFLAGFLYGLYHGKSLAECALYGNITGGKCVTAPGCLTAYCTEDELLERAERYRHFLP